MGHIDQCVATIPSPDFALPIPCVSAPHAVARARRIQHHDGGRSMANKRGASRGIPVGGTSTGPRGARPAPPPPTPYSCPSPCTTSTPAPTTTPTSASTTDTAPSTTASVSYPAPATGTYAVSWRCSGINTPPLGCESTTKSGPRPRGSACQRGRGRRAGRPGRERTWRYG